MITSFNILGCLLFFILVSLILSAWFLPEHIFNLISNGPNLRNATQSINIETPTKVIELSLILQLVGIFITVLLGSKILDFMAMKELDERFKKLEEKNEEKFKQEIERLEKDLNEKLNKVEKRMSETVARRIDAYMKEILILLQKEREKGEGEGKDK